MMQSTRQSQHRPRQLLLCLGWVAAAALLLIGTVPPQNRVAAQLVMPALQEDRVPGIAWMPPKHLRPPSPPPPHQQHKDTPRGGFVVQEDVLFNQDFILKDDDDWETTRAQQEEEVDQDEGSDQEEYRRQLEEECQRHLNTPPLLGTASTLGSTYMSEPSLSSPSSAALYDNGSISNSTWKLWYRSPAKNIQKEGLLIGNGRTQVLIGGGINVERLVLSEESCWSGGPGAFKKSTPSSSSSLAQDSDPPQEYRGGNVAEGEEAQQRQEALKDFRKMLEEKQVIHVPSSIVKTLQGDERGFGRPEAFGQVILEELRPFSKVERYHRELDLETGIVKVSFLAGDIRYMREHFCSFPDAICVMRLEASSPKSINIKVSLQSAHDTNLEYTNIHNRLGFRAQLASNNMTIDAQVMVKPEGVTGVSMSNSRQVVALGFDSITLYYSMGTSYAANAYPSFKGKDPHDRLVSAVDKATTMYYPDQIQMHLQDYQGLFNGFGLDLGYGEGATQAKALSTDELVEKSQRRLAADVEEAYLEGLMVQYARYLLIAQSRPGSLPISGKSAWLSEEQEEEAQEDSPQDGYKMNIDLQMNYWLAEATGLGETVTPLMDYIENLLVPRGQDTASLHYGARGWTTHTYSNIWAHTGPTAQTASFYFPAANAWLSQHAWDRYLYTQDYYFLRDHAYKLMKGATQFWLDSLVYYEKNVNQTGSGLEVGRYLTSPSYSPEHGFFTFGSALDQQLIWHLFNATLEATTLVGERDKVFIQNLTQTFEELSTGLKVGSWGQLQEWELDLDEPNENHRHLAPFWSVYPGHEIFLPRGENSSTGEGDSEVTREELLKAARLTLQRRGMGLTEGNLAWPKSWRAAAWARLQNSKKAVEAMTLFKKHHMSSKNLLDFEQGLTGQLGMAAAMIEMMIQSPSPGFVDILPLSPGVAAATLADDGDDDDDNDDAAKGLPDRWLKKGAVWGYRTREGHNVTASWEDAKVRMVQVLPVVKAAVLKVRIGTMRGEAETPNEKVHVSILGSTKVPVYTREEDAVVLTMSKGQTYQIQIDI
ncbi:hypothetical protein EDD11_004585 [Mortierella claussenii]|nr:hypothetical protein EDD11_004585 [Mortierella claussenii]